MSFRSLILIAKVGRVDEPCGLRRETGLDHSRPARHRKLQKERDKKATLRATTCNTQLPCLIVDNCSSRAERIGSPHLPASRCNFYCRREKKRTGNDWSQQQFCSFCVSFLPAFSCNEAKRQYERRLRLHKPYFLALFDNFSEHLAPFRKQPFSSQPSRIWAIRVLHLFCRHCMWFALRASSISLFAFQRRSSHSSLSAELFLIETTWRLSNAGSPVDTARAVPGFS